jgi:beta-xylosidase
MTLMKTGIQIFFIVAVGFFSSGGLHAQRSNEKAIKPGVLWMDADGKRINAHGGCVIFYEGIYYWYGEEKVEGLSEKEHADGGVHCYASQDLIEWHDQGMILHLSRADTLRDLSFDCNQDRPKVVYNQNTRQFVLFFKLYLRNQGVSTAYVGVAVSSSPVGPFIYQHKFLGGNSPNGTGDFAMFQDNDGALYHLTVRKPDKTFVIGKMRDDYLMPEGKYEVCEGITTHTEAPAVFKKDGLYYILASGSTGWNPNPARYFTSENLKGPWVFHGNPCEGTNPNNGLGKEKTFGGQSNYVIPVPGKRDAFIACFDINKPEHPYDSKYIWLPIEFEEDKMSISWRDGWNQDVFQE